MTYHVLKLAHRGTPAQTLTLAAAPVMHDLSTHISQSCHLVVRIGTQGLVILRQENQKGHANLSVRQGAVIDLFSSCSGHVLLAHLDAEERDRMPRPLRAAARTKLEKILARVAKRGYELHPSPITAGVTDISFPVRGFDGNVVAALTVAYLHVLDHSLPTGSRKPWDGCDSRRAVSLLLLAEDPRREVLQASPPRLPFMVGAGRFPVHVLDTRFRRDPRTRR